jgi:hypothetical protein
MIEYFSLAFDLVFWNIVVTVEVKKLLIYKEELLTDVKNILYHCTDDIEKLQKVIADTE